MKTELQLLLTASFFGAFTTPAKLAVLKSLLSGPEYVSAIGERTGLGQPITSKVLMELKAANLVTCTRQGRKHYYELKQRSQFKTLFTIAEEMLF
jgi:DNA-binding transcriptional ArsR family regulator